jgi:DNA polymerase
MRTLKQLAVESLTHLVEGGRERLAVDDEARGILRQWMLDAKAGSRNAAVENPPARPEAQEPEMKVEAKLAYLRARAEDWKPAARLGTLREKMVFAVGNPRARLMLVGEAPGYEEERQGEPFVGPAGQLLTKILNAMGLQRQEVYISNVCKFRPAMGENQGTANRPPSPEELVACLPLIMAEIRAIQPACIVCLGGSSAKGLLGTQQGVSALRGRWLDCQGVPVRVTYHPSYLLRNESLSARRDLWVDMLEVMKLLGMPISEKQQNYFR